MGGGGGRGRRPPPSAPPGTRSRSSPPPASPAPPAAPPRPRPHRRAAFSARKQASRAALRSLHAPQNLANRWSRWQATSAAACCRGGGRGMGGGSGDAALAPRCPVPHLGAEGAAPVEGRVHPPGEGSVVGREPARRRLSRLAPGSSAQLLPPPPHCSPLPSTLGRAARGAPALLRRASARSFPSTPPDLDPPAPPCGAAASLAGRMT